MNKEIELYDLDRITTWDKVRVAKQLLVEMKIDNYYKYYYEQAYWKTGNFFVCKITNEKDKKSAYKFYHIKSNIEYFECILKHYFNTSRINNKDVFSEEEISQVKIYTLKNKNETNVLHKIMGRARSIWMDIELNIYEIN